MNSDAYFEIGPSTSLVENFVFIPDICLEYLQKCAQYQLSPEQYKIAKLSAIELADCNGLRLTIADLVTIWEATPALSDFAEIIRRFLLPQ